LSEPVFGRVAVVGLGLMGGSAALAALERGVAREVQGVDPGLDRAGPIPLVSLAEAAAWARKSPAAGDVSLPDLSNVSSQYGWPAIWFMSTPCCIP
jgi:hypothetical protein